MDENKPENEKPQETPGTPNQGGGTESSSGERQPSRHESRILRRQRKKEERSNEKRTEGRKQGLRRVYVGIAVLVVILIAYIAVSTLMPQGQQVTVETIASDDPSLGSQDAPVVMVEFSDFQCPACGTFFRETETSLKQKYVDTGKMRIVYRDFPLLNLHPLAQTSAEAAECMNEQGKFWGFHDQIFRNQESLSVENLKQWAFEEGADMDKFNLCYDSGKYRSEVQGDFSDGRALNVDSTPTIFIGKKGEPAQKLSGQPRSVIEATIDNLLLQ